MLTSLAEKAKSTSGSQEGFYCTLLGFLHKSRLVPQLQEGFLPGKMGVGVQHASEGIYGTQKDSDNSYV